ncbi:sulfatase family protein [Salegentibacter sp. F14]
MNYKLLLLLGSLYLFSALNIAKAQEKEKPNIVVIFADDLGYGDLSSYGHPVIQTPKIDKMADEGMRLTSFYVAASTCTPSRAALLTGRYPLRTGLPHVIFPESEKGLPASEITMAEALKNTGYRTMAVGKWHLGQSKEEFWPTEQGFDKYYGLITSNDMRPPWVDTDVPLHLYRGKEPVEEYPVDQTTLTKRYTAEAVKFIEESKDEPFFLYLPHNMPHVPLFASENFKDKSAGGLYGDVIEELDWSVGEILKALEDNDLDENTIVIFTSDNGPWDLPDRIFVDDIVKPWDGGSSGLLKGGKTNTYEGGLRVPFVIRWPEKIPANKVSLQLATSLDLFSTLIQLAGGEVPQDRQIDGENILPIFLGDTAFKKKKDFYYFEGEFMEAIRSGDWKLRIAPFKIQAQGKKVRNEPSYELYNLSLDPSEHYNRASEFPEIVAELKQKMLDFKIEGVRKRFKD